MVSHPESSDAGRPMALPAPPQQHPPPPGSVASSRPNHHHHRNRSRHGGGSRSHRGGSVSSSSNPHMNEFPLFSSTGDVEIVIRAADQSRRYLLHRLILAQNSGFFEAGMSEEWSRVQAKRESDADADAGANGASSGSDSGYGTATGSGNPRRNVVELPAINEDRNESSRTAEPVAGSSRRTAAAQGKSRWRYELDWENREEDEVPILVQKPPSVNNSVFGGEIPTRATPSSSRNKPTAPHQGFFRSMANLTGFQSALHLPGTAEAPDEPPVDPTIRDYDNLLRIFYNYSPQLNSVNIATAYSECKSLLVLADMYDALPVTGPRIDHHLLRFSSRLYKQIAKYPPSYLKLGYLARSRVIFSEALIHVVGQWPAALPHLGSSSYSPVPDVVLDLIEDKVDDLEDVIARIEGKLFRLTLTTPKGERVNPSNAYLDWLAISLFRQWLVDNTTPPPAPILKTQSSQPNRSSNSNNQNGTSSSNNNAASQGGGGVPRQGSSGSGSTTLTPYSPGAGSGGRSKPKPAPPAFSIGRTYRLLGSSSNQAYLPHDELKRFLKLQQSSDSLYSRENLKRFEKKMDEIKRLAREIVKPLMRNFLELDLRSLGGGSGGGETGILLPYLTCTRVEEGDFPWD